MQPIHRNHVTDFSRTPGSRSMVGRLRPPSEQHQKIIKDYCQYELRRAAHGTTIVAKPLTQAAEIWMAGQKVDELRMACHDSQAGAWIRSIECAIDTAPR